MATLQIDDIADRAINSLNQLQKGAYIDAMAAYQDVPMARIAHTMGKETSGKKLEFRLLVGSENTNGQVGMYEDHDMDRQSVMTNGSVSWTQHVKGFPMDLRELDPRSSPEHIIDDMEVQRNNMWHHIAEDFENNAWQVPALNDPLLPFGLPYWIPWSSTALGSFHAGLPSGHTDIAGIDPAVQTKYQSWADTYALGTRDDLGRKISKAIRNTNFRPPMRTKGQTVTHAFYTTQQGIEDLEKISEVQNDQLGRDGQPMFKRSLIAGLAPQWVPALDDLAAADSDPIYLVAHQYLIPWFKAGWKFREYPARPAAKQRTVIETEVHTVYQWSCSHRKAQACIAKGAPFGE